MLRDIDRPPWTASTVYSALVNDPDRTSATVAAEATLERAAHAWLLQASLHRHSRRFAMGLRLNGGPFAYFSTVPPRRCWIVRSLTTKNR